MALGADLELRLRKKFEPSSSVNMTFRGNDIVVQTDRDGNAVLMFIGKFTPHGKIKGERYARTLKADATGRIIKDHWDLKGKTEG